MTLNVSNNECDASKTKFIQIGNVVAMKQDSGGTIIKEDTIIEENLNSGSDIVCKVIPNPSRNIFNIILDNNIKAEYGVTDILGKKIFSGKITDGKIILNAESWQTGIYLLFIKTGTQSKVIKLMKL
jgi:hypothetical protein